ncbi:glycoside hydrolase family 35 protein [Micromonospora sp. C28ISP2-4]|uniref:glycoside hydrolase family 35 protein n=1 Tax=Micromonospora sp. C28ISP2-4 TaxID=3059523 RepID=UPI0026758AF5|nr:glycoside hydrolase family 35 protein [Micromonospora sp. C28ISP2-4]MDO3686875.1 beta-galactosidase [Micromonospora sp. C28ISP2-4]
MIETTGRSSVVAPSTRPSPALGWRDRQLYRNGVPHRVLSGALHYFRVHPALWRDRIRRLADLGLNTLDTYVPWNFHQPHEDRAPRFDGWRDVEAFVALAGEEGLDVVLRPGPYICAEWSNGGLPAWLTARDVALRSSDPAFTEPVERWFDELIPRIARQQGHAGGPVVAVQVENEYGSYGDDEAYLRWNRSALIDRGISELLFTADGPTELMLDAGTLPGTLAAATLGSKPEAARALLAQRRPDEPFMVAEYWNGWFDHWGERHHVRGVDSAVHTLAAVIDDGGSVSIYMAHGGTNFGLWAGANADGGRLQPTVTSYDSDAPIAEDGTLTAKFHAMRATLGATGPIRVPERMPLLPPARVLLTHRADLIAGVRAVPARDSTGPRPATFEQLGLDAGMVLHTAHPRIPPGEHTIVLNDVRDRAVVLVDGVPLGVADAAHPTLRVHGTGAVVRLEILVENLGRINYGPLIGQHKGLLGPVLVDRRIVHGWASAAIALPDWTSADLFRATGAGPARTAAGFAVATVHVDTPADTFLALPGSVHGMVWVNGFLLGRYWDIGPQVTLYCPAPLLHAGENTVVVLETDRLGTVLELRDAPELGPTEEYVEEFD